MKTSILLVGYLVLSIAFPLQGISQAKPVQDNQEATGSDKSSESLWKKHIQLYDTSASLIINRIEDINSTMNDIDEVMASGFDTAQIDKELPPLERTIQIIRFNIFSRSGSMNLRSLSVITDVLNETAVRLKGWQTSLFGFSTELVSFSAQIRSMTHDSTLRSLPADTALRFLYNQQLRLLKTKWKTADSSLNKSLVRINSLEGEVSDNYILAMELQNKISGLIRDFWDKVLGREYNEVWRTDTSGAVQPAFSAVYQTTLSDSHRVMSYYLKANWGIRILDIFIGLLFFFWTFLHLRKVSRVKEDKVFIEGKLKLIQPVPVLASLVVMLNILPIITQHPPSVYSALVQLALALTLTFILGMRWPPRLLACWIILVCLLEVHEFGNLLASSAFMPRNWLLGIDLFSVLFGFVLVRETRENTILLEKYIRPLVVVYLTLNLLAVLCNAFGRVTLAELMSSTAIYSLFLAISLMIFIRIILEAVFLQLEADKNTNRFTSYIEYENIEGRLKGILTVLAGIFWFINLTQNLNIYDVAYDQIKAFLVTDHQVGSTTFTFGSVLVFFFVLWLANIIQKYLGFFFKETTEDWQPGKSKGTATSVLLIRLVVMVGGFLLGVAASGLPVDKITVVLGALGVGVGLGLQGVVNQLVSGIILAIEKPIRVGDEVEIGTKSGRVKEIGIRSSRIITPEGAEIIVPNADLLSQNLTNWTVNNSHVRVEIIVKMESNANLDRAEEIIRQLLTANEGVMKKPEPQLLFRSIDQNGAELQVLFWAFDISKWIQLKSDILKKIYEDCIKEGIKLI